MERVIKVRVLGRGEVREVTLQEAQRILEDTCDDPIGGLVANGKTNEVIFRIDSDVEEIIIMEQMLGGG